MALPVPIREFVSEMQTYGEDEVAYINRRTGEFHTTGYEDRRSFDEPDEESDDLGCRIGNASYGRKREQCCPATIGCRCRRNARSTNTA